MTNLDNIIPFGFEKLGNLHNEVISVSCVRNSSQAPSICFIRQLYKYDRRLVGKEWVIRLASRCSALGWLYWATHTAVLLWITKPSFPNPPSILLLSSFSSYFPTSSQVRHTSNLVKFSLHRSGVQTRVSLWRRGTVCIVNRRLARRRLRSACHVRASWPRAGILLGRGAKSLSVQPSRSIEYCYYH